MKLGTDETQTPVSVGNGSEVQVAGVGTVTCIQVASGKQVKIELRDVLLVPSLM